MTRLILAAAVAVGLGGCAGPPWQMGSPLDGRPSIPSSVAFATVNQRRAEVVQSRAAAHTVLELRALEALDAAERLTAAERDRLFDLLVQRAEEFRELGRDIPRNEDLRRAAQLSATRGKALQTVRVQAELAAGDAWLGIGDRGRAQAAYREAEALGALDVAVRMMATREDTAPEVLAVPELAHAISVLPLRVVPRFAAAYVAAGGDHLPTLERSLAAARQEGRRQLAIDVQGKIAATAAATSVAGGEGPERAASAAPHAGPVPADLAKWVLGGASLSARLLPLLAARPALFESETRLRFWADLMLAEDPGSPDVLEAAALVDGLAGRFGGTERRLLDLVYYSSDRYQGMIKSAAVWEKVGRLRDACVQRVRAARWRDDPEDPMWRMAIGCTRRDPAAGDWRTIRQYVIERAPRERQAAIAASLDAPEGRIAADR